MATSNAKCCTANMDFARGNDKGYLRHLTECAHVLMLQEAKTFDLDQLLPDGWAGLQNTSSEAKAGSCIAVDKGKLVVVEWHLTYGCDAPADGGMLPRWICSATLEFKETGKRFTAISGHEPPQRYAHLQPEFTTNLKDAKRDATKPVIGVDANMPMPELAAHIGGTAYGYGIVGHVTNQVVEWKSRIDYGPDNNMTDHPAVNMLVTFP